MKLFPDRRRAAGTPPARPQDPFWWLRDRDAMVRRFVLAQVLDEPRAKRPLPGLRPGRQGR